jgi:lytic murein transglycosylase
MKRPIAALAVLALITTGAAAQQACDKGANFRPWLAEFKKEAVAEGIPAEVVETALRGVEYNPKIVGLDRAQSVFSQSFLQFVERRVADYRLTQGKAKIAKFRDSFERIEAEFGVPPAVLTGFWGLETDFGAVMGDLESIHSVATLAYDCRRPEMFRDELKDLLRIIARGDLTAEEMRGPWAGELGQFQFLPTYYLAQGVDYDGDGKVNLIRSTPDALASAANLMKSFGWRAGEPWLEEVTVPAEMDWQQADIAIQHPVSYWLKAGVKPAHGPLKGENLEASLHLPMGRNGPAFLAYPNFQAYLQWNQSLVYATTAAYFATRLAGAPAVGPGRGTVEPLAYKDIVELQKLLVARGHDVGKVDGKLGAATRAAVKAVQLELGLPADSYPDQDFLSRLRAK